MSSKKHQLDMATHYADYCDAVFGKEIITPDDLIEIQTLCAIGIELIKSSSASKVRDAGLTVEIRNLIKKDKR